MFNLSVHLNVHMRIHVEYMPYECSVCNKGFITLSGLQQHTRCSKKTDALICFCNNFSKCTPILILFSLLQQENYGAQNLSYFSYLTFIMLPLYLAKQTLMLVSM